MALYQQAEQLLMDDAGIIPLYHAPDFVANLPNLLSLQDDLPPAPFERIVESIERSFERPWTR